MQEIEEHFALWYKQIGTLAVKQRILYGDECMGITEIPNVIAQELFKMILNRLPKMILDRLLIIVKWDDKNASQKIEQYIVQNTAELTNEMV